MKAKDLKVGKTYVHPKIGDIKVVSFNTETNKVNIEMEDSPYKELFIANEDGTFSFTPEVLVLNLKKK